MFNTLKQWWEDIKAFFAYSHTIFVARLTAVIGFIVSVFGIIDWSPLMSLNLSTGFSKAQVIWLGIITFLKGVTDEIARRAKGVIPPTL